jgi:hypothetical protein
MHVVKNTGIQNFLRKPEQEEPLGKLEGITQYSFLESSRVGELYFF